MFQIVGQWQENMILRGVIAVFLISGLVSPNAAAETTAFINVNLIAMVDDRVTPAQTVIVSDGRIATIGPVDVTELPRDAMVVDGTDRYLLPGLVEMHGDISGTRSASLDSTLGLFVANGVTTVRGMLGQPAHLELRQKILDQSVLGPRLITSGPAFNGNTVDGAQQAMQRVGTQSQAGYDFLRIGPGLSRAEFMAIAATANKLGIPFAGDVPSDVGVPAALEAGIATIDHFEGYMQTLISPHEAPSGGLGGFFGLLLAAHADETRIAAIAAATAEAGVWNVPTESLFENFANDVAPEDMRRWPEMKYVSAATVSQWVDAKQQFLDDEEFDIELGLRAIDLRRKLIMALHQAGAGLLLGSDSPQRFNVPGFALHRELSILVAAGLSPYEALRTGTVNPAIFFGTEAELGTIEVGKIADLVLLDQNPLSDIENIRRVHGTMLRGRWVSRPQLDVVFARAERN